MSHTATRSPEDTHGLGRGEFIALMSIVSATIAISIDTVLPAFDEIESEYGLSAGGAPVSLTITVFLVAMGLGMVVWGPLSDRFGRKPVMYVSLLLFVTGALIATMSGSFTMFLVGRAVWGAAAAGPRAIGVAIIRDAYEGDLMARIMSLSSAVFLVVPTLAPGLGELVLAVGSWRWTTAVGAALGCIVAIWLTRMNETLDPDAVVPLEYRRVTRAGRAVLTNRTTVLFTIATTMAYGAFFPWLGSSVQMISEIYDRPEQFAVLFGLNAVAMAITILLTERLVKRFTTYPVVLAETALMLAVAVVYVVWAASAGGVIAFLPWFLLASTLTALNAGANPLMQTMAMQPMGRIAGTASSVSGAIVFVFGALLGGVIDAFIDTTVTPFGVGFLVYGAVTLVAVWLGRPDRN